MVRKSAKRPRPLPLSVPNADRNLSRSAGVSRFAFFRILTMTGSAPSNDELDVSTTSILASPCALLGKRNSPATKKRTGLPSRGSASCSVGVPRSERTLSNSSRPRLPVLRMVTATGAGPAGASRNANVASTGAQHRNTRPSLLATETLISTCIAPPTRSVTAKRPMMLPPEATEHNYGVLNIFNTTIGGRPWASRPSRPYGAALSQPGCPVDCGPSAVGEVDGALGGAGRRNGQTPRF